VKTGDLVFSDAFSEVFESSEAIFIQFGKQKYPHTSPNAGY
jgi:hypothetical protein